MAILSDDMRRVVEEQQLGLVATVCPDGSPNVSPKGTTAVWSADQLVFADLRSPTTTANLLADPRVEIVVVDPFVRKGYRFKGTAEVHADSDVFERGIHFYEARGLVDPRGRIRAVVVVTVERALAVTSPAYDLGVDENELRRRHVARLTGAAGGPRLPEP